MNEDTIELTLNSPITEEQWDVITDVDFDNTDRISFHTKHGKEVEFVKHIRGRWVLMSDIDGDYYCCSQCGEELPRYSLNTPTWDGPYTYLRSIDKSNFCPNCGADMRKGEEEQDD
ncbi:MAG: hypothetical protein IIZ34_05745 [Eubacterium sp.]|nr:hypothetical protein [Eubacterium sp.]